MANMLFSNVRILDGSGDYPFLGEVLVQGNRIKQVNHGSRTVPSNGHTVIDGAGATLMPGMCEAHTHLSWNNQPSLEAIQRMPPEEHTLYAADMARLLLDMGFTSAVGAAAAKPRLDVVIRNAINAGQIPGPRYLANGQEIATAGGLGDTSPPHIDIPEMSFGYVVSGPEEIEQRKKIRNDIEQDTLIQIRNKNLETEKLSLDIDRDSEYARLEQTRELELRRVSQTTELAQQRAQQEQTAEATRIQARQGTETARISADYALDEARIQRECDTERLEIQRRQALELAKQDRAIAIAQKSSAQSEAQAEAELTRAQAVTAEEKVFTAREVEIAERAKRIDLVAAEQQAEREGVQIRMAAAAHKAAAADRAEAHRLDAEGEAEAEKIRALAAKLRHQVEAEGARLMNEAQNVLSDESRVSNLRLQLVERLEAIIRESVKPMERIEGIKILQVDGLGGAPAGGGKGESASNGNLADSMVNSALRYRAQAPLIDTLLREVGLSGGGLQELGSLFSQENTAASRPRGSVAHDSAGVDGD